MKLEQVKEIANAVLYEGYLLYPYRRSAIKNRRRWTFGVVYPQEYSAASGGLEPWTMRTECLLSGSTETTLDIYFRFLHLLRHIPASSETVDTGSADEWRLTGRMANEAWEEGIEREMRAQQLALSDLLDHEHRVEITFPYQHIEEAEADTESRDDAEGRALASITPTINTREQQSLTGAVIIAAEPVNDDIYKLSVQVENTTPGTGELSSNAALLHSFVSTHAILRVAQGAFISLMDPPDALKDIARECRNQHTWPVLAGVEGDVDTMLSSPIILYDYPQIAPESPGALFDGTEIDEILTLRIMTLTDEEKREMREGDERAREILERTESLSPEQFMKMHGVIRSLRPVDEENQQVGRGQASPLPSAATMFPGEDYPPPTSIVIDGMEVKTGDRVRLHPRARADVFDMLLDGKMARVELIHQDFENRLYLVVTLDDDPGREQWDERVLPGHRFFFYPEEVEPLDDTANRSEGI